MKSRGFGVATLLSDLSLAALLLSGPGCNNDARFESSGGELEPDPAVELVYTEDFELVAKKSGWGTTAAFYKPVAPDGSYALGHYAQTDSGPPYGWMFVARELESGALAEPVDYELVGGSTPHCSLWKPIPPPGYVGLGFAAHAGDQKPDTDEIRCLREDLAAPATLGRKIWPSVTLAGGHYVRQIVPDDEEGIYIGSFAYTAPHPPFYVPFCIHEDSVQKEVLCREDVDELVREHGPLLFFYPHEEYFLHEPEYVLDCGASLEWGMVYNESDFESFRVEEHGSMPTSAATLLDDVRHIEENIKPLASDPGSFKYWLAIDDGIKPGDPAYGEALIRVLPVNAMFTEIQFWFFYPFNGPGRVEICLSSGSCANNYLREAGRHYGDWEHVSLLFLNSTRELTTVYLSRHASGQWLRRCAGAWESGLEFSDTHPIVYSALYSHAHYPTAGKHYYERVFSLDWGLGTISADLFDLTGDGACLETFRPDSYRVVSSALPGYQVTEPEWLEFRGRWGQYEKLFDQVSFSGIPVYPYVEIGNGPSGPAMKAAWTDGDCSQVW